MNWTGGELMRAAPTKARILKQKQKAQFARARAAAAHVSRLSGPTTPSLPTTQPGSIGQPSGVPSTHRGTTSTNGMDREEYRLLMKRQELLRRPDWLDLQVTKPMEISFTSKSDKLLIGRRRKTRKTSAKPDMVPRRQHPYQIDLPARGFAAKQASTHEDISVRIKIGTDALDSQTQHSNLLRPTEQRDASADLESLSEEPMLLDSDDDLFERVTPRDSPRYVHDHGYGRPVNDQSQHEYIVADSTRMVPTDNTPAASTRVFAEVHPASSEQALPWATSVIGDPPVHTTVADPPSMREELRASSEKGVQANDEYQHAWKRFCGIDTSSYHNASLRVQPTQNETSTSSWLSPTQPKQQDCKVPVGLEYHKPQQEPNTAQTQHVLAQAKTASPQQEAIQNQTTLHQTQEELWRRFILGDNHSDSEDSLPIAPKRQSNSSPKSLKPLSVFDTDSTHDSLMATRGARTHAIPSSRLMAGANSSLDGLASSQPSTVRTTAAVASSTWRSSAHATTS